MSKFLRTVLTSGLAAYLALCAILFFYQRSLLYFPQPASGSSGGATIALPVAEARVTAVTRLQEGQRALLYFGGNAEDVSQNLPSFSAGFPDSAIYLLNYRGYGGSTGKPSEQALFHDALALFDQVHAEHPDIDVVGRSLGSGVAAYLASRRPVARLVLVTPYDSIVDLAARQYPYFPVRWLVLDRFESSKYAPDVTAPTEIIAAEHDDVVPRASTELLRSRFRSGLVTYDVLRGAGHNSIASDPQYLVLLQGRR